MPITPTRRRAAPPAGRITAQARDEAVWLIKACSAFDLIANAPVMSEQDRSLIVEKLFIPAAKNIEMYLYGGAHNILVWQGVSVLMAGSNCLEMLI